MSRSRNKHPVDERRRKHYQKLLRVQASHRALSKRLAKVRVEAQAVDRINALAAEENIRLREENRRWRDLCATKNEAFARLAQRQPLRRVVQAAGSDTFAGIQIRALHELLDQALAYVPDDDAACSRFKTLALNVLEEGV